MIDAVTTSEDTVVTVRYRLCVYADVNLTTGRVVRVVEDDESSRLDYQLPDEKALAANLAEQLYLGGLGNKAGGKVFAAAYAKQLHKVLREGDARNVVEASYLGEVKTLAGDEITTEIARKATETAEQAEWPQWERA